MRKAVALDANFGPETLEVTQISIFQVRALLQNGEPSPSKNPKPLSIFSVHVLPGTSTPVIMIRHRISPHRHPGF